MRRMIPQKLIDVVKALAPKMQELLDLASAESSLSALAEKSTELLAIEDVMSVGENGVQIDDDAEITGDLTAKTFSQSQSNWSFELPEFTPAEGLALTKGYGKIVQYGNLLYLVINYSLNNPTGNSIVQQTIDIDVDLPTEIASKIFDITGTPASESVVSGQLIAEYFIYASGVGGTATSSIGRISNKTGANRVSIRLLQQTSISAGSTIYFTGRLFLVI